MMRLYYLRDFLTITVCAVCLEVEQHVIRRTLGGQEHGMILYKVFFYRFLKFILCLCVGVQIKLVPQTFVFVNYQGEPTKSEPQHTEMTF